MVRRINAIETKYKRIIFRSQLEAKWALFWDKLRLKWVYEPECVFSDGTKYTPDFWIPDLSLFIEIKPNETIAKEEGAISKCKKLADETGARVYLDMGGFAWPISEECAYSSISYSDAGDVYSILFYVITGYIHGEYVDFVYDSFNHYWATCRECGKLGLAKHLRIGYSTNYIFSCECNTQKPNLSLNSNSEILLKAYDEVLSRYP